VFKSFSISKIIVVGALALLIALAGIWLYKKAEPEETLPSITPEEIKSQNLSPEPYRNSRIDFQINPPAGWIIDETGSLGAFVVFINPATDADSNGQFNANITVTAEPANYLEDFARKTRIALPQILDSYTMSENQRIKIGPLEAHLIGGNFIYEKQQLKTLRLLRLL